MEIRQEHLEGGQLIGNDLCGHDLEQWYAEEANGFYQLIAGDQPSGDPVAFELDTKALNKFHGSYLPKARFAECVAIGCANGSDLLALGRDIGRVTAIEPSKEWWADSHGGVPFSYKMPTLDGTIELADNSMDLAVALGALHHVATVEHVVGEMIRVLKPGGWMIVREPIMSMGDFRGPRPGLTRYERGIPFDLMKRFIAQAGGRVVHTVPSSFQAIKKATKPFGIEAHNHASLVRLDYLASRLFMFNARYWRPRLIDKVAPTSMVYVATKA